MAIRHSHAGAWERENLYPLFPCNLCHLSPDMDAATSRTIKIGATSIGLIGLDIAINKATACQLPEIEAMDFLFRSIKEKNYIPAGMEEKYRIALLKEYAKHLHGDNGIEDGLVIRIFGKPCLSCNNLQSMVIEILSKLDLGADIEQIHDPDEIGRAGVIHTPALIINGKLKVSGLLPSRAQVEQWIRDTVNRRQGTEDGRRKTEWLVSYS